VFQQKAYCLIVVLTINFI